MGKKIIIVIMGCLLMLTGGWPSVHTAFALPPDPPTADAYQAFPVFQSANVPPLVMLVMGRNHKLYYEAYNDASDLNGDDILDVGYDPQIDYYGYFDSYKYYEYDSSNHRFVPRGIASGKKAPSGDYWSGDYLNYLSMSRMDTLRKVLYGGYRSADTTTETVLQRIYIPQDAHSWGKEYESIARDGYDIREYTPLDLPSSDTRHLFASTTLSDNGTPILRVLPDNSHRIWEWVAKERPVCDDSLESSGGQYNSHPNNHTEYENMVAVFANSDHLQGSQAATQINGSGNPFGPDDYYLTIFTGTIQILTGGDYDFAVDGDDAVEVIIDGTAVAGWYGGHGGCNCLDHSGTIYLDPGNHTLEFRHQERTGGDNYYLWWKGPDSGNSWEIVPASAFNGLTQSVYDVTIPNSNITDYDVRVQVCVDGLLEPNCKKYSDPASNPTGSRKPTGILQRYGETERMYFGLLTGSYAKNTSGGVLRKPVGSITDEIEPATGQFTNANGIISTINKFRISEFRYSDHTYNPGWSGAWVTTRPMNEGEFPDWGNPVAEMMYETLRYYAGKSTPTDDFHDASMSEDDALGLPNAAWEDPYANYSYCAKPFMLVLTDINPTYDSDQLPGSYFGSAPAPNDLAGLDVASLGDTIFAGEPELTAGSYYIGHEATAYDGSCSPKTVNGFGDVRGLCEEEPSKEGSYYSASVAHFGRTNDISTIEGDQKVQSYMVGLASPLPRINIPVGGSNITLVPFAKSVGGCLGIDGTQGDFQSTNTIVDFFVETITPTYGRFRINYEDVEQAADHDMDAIVTYEYQLVDAGGNPVGDPADGTAVQITLSSGYASGCIIQHIGYIISGTTVDGTYLEVVDSDIDGSDDPDNDVDYFLDTPPGQNPGGLWVDGAGLPFVATRVFTAGTNTAASLLKNPLWYAAKWGGFEDKNGNNIPDLTEEWDQDADGVPDTYFYVVNPLKLEEQLNKSFAAILEKAASGTATSVLATNSEGEGNMVQAYFRPKLTTANNEVTWLGYLQSLWIDEYGNLREDTDGNIALDITQDKVIRYFVNAAGDTKVKKYTVDASNPYPDLDDADCIANGTCEEATLEEIIPIFEAGKLLAERDADERRIFTFIDTDNDGVVDEGTYASFDNNGEVITFDTSSASALKPYLDVKDDTAWSYLGTTHDERTNNLISYIRGLDAGDLTGTVDTRNKTLDNNTVWKLGDIVNSTPVVIAKPAENFHIIYSDRSYQNFLNAVKDREMAVYVGANDGTLHAFTSWKYDSDSSEYTDPYPSDNILDPTFIVGEQIGDELWAFIPQSLLPHLKWLADPNYAHTYYVDLKPKVFDAKILPDGTHYTDTDGADNWGTILLGGLNMGGKYIWAEGDYDGNGTSEFRDFYPSYFCIDITNPRNPKLLWERTYTNLGMSRSVPAVVRVGDKWFAVFGSGPTDYDGSSTQNGHIFVVDLKTGEPYSSGGNDWLFGPLEANAFMNSPVALDMHLNNNVDGIYFGEAYLSGFWQGKVYKLTIPCISCGWDGGSDTYDSDPLSWDASILFDSDRPITASMALSVDHDDNAWIYFGTGRYISQSDKTDSAQQYLYGIKDPFFNANQATYYHDYASHKTLVRSDLFASDDIVVTTSKTVLEGGSPFGTNGTWDELLVAARSQDGWYRSLDTPAGPSERSVSKSSVLGGIVFNPTFTPNSDVCGFGGESNFYALYYETGTAYYKQIFNISNPSTVTVDGQTEDVAAVKLPTLIFGAPPPSVGMHVGREKGARAYLQQSTGQVVDINVDTAFNIKSGLTSWREE